MALGSRGKGNGKEKGKEKGKEERKYAIKETTKQKGRLKGNHSDPGSPSLLKVEIQNEGATARGHRFTVGDALRASAFSGDEQDLLLSGPLEVLLSLYGHLPLALLTAEKLKIWLEMIFAMPSFYRDPLNKVARPVEELLGYRGRLACRVETANWLMAMLGASFDFAFASGWVNSDQAWRWWRPIRIDKRSGRLLPTDSRRLQALFMGYFGPFTPMAGLGAPEDLGRIRAHGLKNRPAPPTVSEVLEFWRSKP
jgi:hypothetical protein